MNFTEDDLARFDPNISASLVYVSGDKSIRIPSICGTPREDQLQGTPYEQLCELAGRACYHSLGKGRNSADYHEHLIESKHWSVYEHAWFAITINVSNVDARRLVPLFTNLKGIKCSEMDVYGCFHVYFNVRHFLDLCTKGRFYGDALARYIVGEMRSQAIDSAFPVVLKPSSTVPFDVKPYKTRLMRPFVSLYLSCSRNASHEQVRHRFAVSQRSTRYCDETDTPFVVHPHDSSSVILSHVVQHGTRKSYLTALGAANCSLQSIGLPATTARKQARGTARGYLPSNLATQMMFTASVSEWAHMIRMRMTDDADAEIRVLYNHILLELAKHPATKKLAEVRTVEAEDGAGFVVDPADKLLDGIADG